MRATTSWDELRAVDAIIICLPTPLTEHREPDLSAVLGAAESLAQRLRPGHLVVLESTTYPGTTREEVAPVLERSGLQGGRDFHLAFSPERVDPGRVDWTTATTPKVIGGLTPRVHAPRDGALRPGLHDAGAGVEPRGGRAHQAAREHLPQRQHRPGQRAGDALRPDGHRRLGRHRRGGHQALRLHAVPPGPRPGRPLHPDRPLLPHVEGPRVRPAHRVHRARRQGQLADARSSAWARSCARSTAAASR